MKCETCGKTIEIGCDWQQGRCPHRSPLLTLHNMRFYLLMEQIKKWFKK